MALDYPRVRIYQDGLPVCGKETDIVRELAGAGSTNHQLVLELAGRGAMLMGTEDPPLLLREYQLQRQHAGAAGDEAAEVLAGRDRFIARRIEATLQDGETGLLFSARSPARRSFAAGYRRGNAAALILRIVFFFSFSASSVSPW